MWLAGGFCKLVPAVQRSLLKSVILPMAVKRAKEIALAFPRGAHQEELINGVLRYAADHGCTWTYITAPESLALSVLDLHGWRGDGIIAALNTPAEANCVRELSMPIVNISGTLPKTPVPRVSLDSHLVGRMAADHLIERGFQEFAYYGLRSVAYSTVRRESFESRLEANGADVRLAVDAAHVSGEGRALARSSSESSCNGSAVAEADRAVRGDRLSGTAGAGCVPAGGRARAAAGGGDWRRQRGGDLHARPAEALERRPQQSAGRLSRGGDARSIDARQKPLPRSKRKFRRWAWWPGNRRRPWRSRIRGCARRSII